MPNNNRPARNNDGQNTNSSAQDNNNVNQNPDLNQKNNNSPISTDSNNNNQQTAQQSNQDNQNKTSNTYQNSTSTQRFPRQQNPASTVPADNNPTPTNIAQNQQDPAAVIADHSSGGGNSKNFKKFALPFLGVLLLVLSIGAGVTLVGQNQNLEEKAATLGQINCTSPKGINILSRANIGESGDLNYTPAPGSYTLGDTVNFRVKVGADDQVSGTIEDEYRFLAFKVTEAPTGTLITHLDEFTEGELVQIHQFGEGTKQQLVHNSNWQPFTLNSNEERYLQGQFTPSECGYFQIDMDVGDFQNSSGDGCYPVTTVASAFVRVSGQNCFQIQQVMCQQILAYDEEWNELSANDLSNLQPGDVVRFGVLGAIENGDGTFDKARFKIDSLNWRPEVTTKIPGEPLGFYDEYTVPEGLTNLKVDAQIHYTGNDTWY